MEAGGGLLVRLDKSRAGVPCIAAVFSLVSTNTLLSLKEELRDDCHTVRERKEG